jgi:glutamine---fructose-6-phosphate transaminase (isomerizing)
MKDTMCGIVGIIGKEEFSVNDCLIKPLKRLEYRGYDSWGIATFEGRAVKEIGHIPDKGLIKDIKTTLGIAHTRWATHGGVTEANSHPHFNSDKTIFAVHNGIIENYLELKKMLEEKGYKFITQTDTEVVPYYFDYMLKHGISMVEVIKRFISEVKGTFAIALFRKNDPHLYAMKRDSPLVFGIYNGTGILASDIYAFSNKTNKAIFFEDNEFAVFGIDSYTFYNSAGKKISKKITEFTKLDEEEKLEKYDHYMIKEIYEQPKVSRRLIEALKTTQKDKLQKFAALIRKARRVVFVAAGTSYHASLVGVSLLNKAGIESHTIIASEFESFQLVDDRTLIIAISQSGETMDVITVLKDAEKKGATVASIVNVPYSTIQRMSSISLDIVAGQEICVASTKAFTNQLVTLFAIASELMVKDIDLEKIPLRIEKTIKDNEQLIKKLAKELYKKKDIFVLGKGVSYPMAREIALKLKEIPYIHAEGMMAGELKHGTIALVEKGTPVICLIPNNNADMLSSTKEVEARGARTIIVSNTNGEMHIPKSTDAEFAIYSGIIGHLLSYYIAKLKKLPIDKPRNLAKSVTVK